MFSACASLNGSQDTITHVDNEAATAGNTHFPTNQSNPTPDVSKSKSSLDLLDRINGMYRLLDLRNDNGSSGMGKQSYRPYLTRALTSLQLTKSSSTRSPWLDSPMLYTPTLISLLQRFSAFAATCFSVDGLSLIRYRSTFALSMNTLSSPSPYTGASSRSSISWRSSTSLIKKRKHFDHCIVENSVWPCRRTFLLVPRSENSGVTIPTLRPGIYLLDMTRTESNLYYIIFWPEDATWDDNSISSVSRNRVTFMR
jgi:hypothetical protein